MNENIRVSIVDDHYLVSEGLRSLLSALPEIQVIGTYKNGMEFLKDIDENCPDVVFLDVNMPILNGLETMEEIMRRDIDCKVICLTMHLSTDLVKRMMEAGAKAYLSKSCDIETMRMAIKTVYQGGYYFNQAIPSDLLNERVDSAVETFVDLDTLTRREKEVLVLICQGFTNKEIGKELFISPRTVDGHREKLLQKTKGKNTAGLVMYAVKNGIV